MMAMYSAELSVEDRKFFFRNYDKFCGLFGAEVVDTLLLGIRANDIVEIYSAPLDGPRVGEFRNYNGKCYQQPQRELGRGSDYITFHNSDWEQTKRVSCMQYLVPNKHQHLCHKKIIEPALHSKFMWLADFKLDIYNMDFRDGHDDEFYVRCAESYGGHRSLYVPYKALFAGDVEAIIKRNEEYLKWYTKSDDVWNSMKNDPQVVAFLSKVKGEQ